MYSSCNGCVFFYEERDVNYRTCKHPDYDEEEDVCPGRYDIEDAKADAKERQKHFAELED